MTETQLDRIENMIKIILQATTTAELVGTNTDSENLKTAVKKYPKTPQGVIMEP